MPFDDGDEYRERLEVETSLEAIKSSRGAAILVIAVWAFCVLCGALVVWMWR